MLDEHRLVHDCVVRLRGLSQGLDQAAFEATWHALRSWLRDVFSQYRGACIPTFARVVWEHAGTAHTPASSCGRPCTAASCISGSATGGTTLRPIFAVSDAFLKAHNLAAGPGVARAATLSGLKLQPTEELNFIKLALRYSTSLTKDVAFRAIKQMLEALGEALGSGAHVSIDLGVGVLHGRDRRLEFEWKTEAMSMTRPTTAMLRQGGALQRPQTAASSVLYAGDGSSRGMNSPWHGAVDSDHEHVPSNMPSEQVPAQQQRPSSRSGPLNPTLRSSASGILQRSDSAPHGPRPGTASIARGKVSSAPTGSTPTAEALPPVPVHSAAARVEQQRPGGFEALADAGAAATAAPAKPLLHTVTLHASEPPYTDHRTNSRQDQSSTAQAAPAIPAAPALPPRPPTAFAQAQQRRQRRRQLPVQQAVQPSPAMVAAQKRSEQERLLRQAQEAAEQAALQAHQQRLEEKTRAMIQARMQQQKELKACLAAQIQEKVAQQQHEKAASACYVPPATLADNEQLAASRKQATGVWKQQLDAQIAERAQVARSTKQLTTKMERAAAWEAMAEAEHADQVARHKARTAADAWRADLAQQELDKRKREAMAAWLQGASVAIVSHNKPVPGKLHVQNGRSKAVSGAPSVVWSESDWDLQERPWSRAGSASVAESHGAPSWWAM